MKRLKQFILSFVVTMGLIATTFTCVNAASYSGSQSATVSTSVGSAKVTCVATYSTTANTRWTTSWSSSSWSNNVMSVIIGHSNTINGTRLTTTGNISMTSYSYAVGTTSKTFKFKFNGSAVVAG